MSLDLVKLLKTDFKDLNVAFSSPRVYLVNHFDNLRNTIDIDCELFVQKNGEKQLESTNQQVLMINELDSFEKACLNNLPNDRLKDDALNKGIKDMLCLIQSKLESLDSQSARHKIREIDELIYQTWTFLERELFQDETFLYLSRHDVKGAFIECEFPTYTKIDPDMDQGIEEQISILFGALYIIQDEFYCSRRINFEKKTKPQVHNASEFFTSEDLRMHVLKESIVKKVEQPVNHVQLDFAKLKRTSMIMNLTSLSADLFNSFQNLQIIYLNNNQLSGLHASLFQGMSQLRILDLSGNNLVELEAGLFRGLSGLEALHLNDNKLTSIESGTFQDLVNLKELELYTNKLTALKSNTFLGLVNLTDLKLTYNEISELETGVFSGLISLKVLWLNENKISTLAPGLFKGLKALEVLSLYSNSLTELRGDIFNNLVSLTDINFYDNQISEIDSSIFKGCIRLKRVNFLRTWSLARGMERVDSLAWLKPDYFEGFEDFEQFLV